MAQSFQFGKKRDLFGPGRFFEIKIPVRQPRMEIPLGEFDQRAREVGLAGIGDRQTPRERAFSALDPDFPIDARTPERQMLTGRTLDRVGAHHHRTGEALSKHGVRITEEDVGRGEVNAGLFLNEGQHRVNRAGSLGNRINVIVRSVGANGAYAPNNNVYSVSKAPGTIDAMLPFIEKETGIHFAAAYVLFSDPYAVLTQGLTSALVVGSDTVQG